MKLLKAAKLTPIEVPAVPGCEDLDVKDNGSSVEISTEALVNDQNPQQQQKQPPPFQFHIKCIPNTKGRKFFFYLNEPAYFSEVMQLTNLIATCTKEDIIHLSIGGVVSMNAANLLVSTLKLCPAYIIGDAPSVYNIYAGAVLAQCDEIVLSPYMVAVYDYPQMSAGGGHNDAEAAIKFNKLEFELTVKILTDVGFLTTEESDRLFKQNLCNIYGNELVDRYRKFNGRTGKVKPLF